MAETSSPLAVETPSRPMKRQRLTGKEGYEESLLRIEGQKLEVQRERLRIETERLDVERQRLASLNRTSEAHSVLGAGKSYL